ncbi:nucleotidyltransferase [Caenimonas koreensis DSM 17982]|uniref:Nucleotidyltransferase n=1 Tax=Caenimonas koreensis DSM 17982 TaxID=1121255 RepID=A0A844BA69_9BURK|nr:nucleotidyltransferase domain-containing protein [Caenimonas koreensis]MRD47431.1 nucleotidyltransferase [Caenimonas koreensis DSM 17982]
MHPSLNIDEATVARFCGARHIRRLALFGSQLKGTARPDSDVDLHVEFDAAHMPGLFGVAAMEIELSDLLGGRRVDLRTAGDLSRYFRAEVVETAEVLFACCVASNTR